MFQVSLSEKSERVHRNKRHASQQRHKYTRKASQERHSYTVISHRTLSCLHLLVCISLTKLMICDSHLLVFLGQSWHQPLILDYAFLGQSWLQPLILDYALFGQSWFQPLIFELVSMHFSDNVDSATYKREPHKWFIVAWHAWRICAPTKRFELQWKRPWGCSSGAIAPQVREACRRLLRVGTQAQRQTRVLNYCFIFLVPVDVTVL